MILSEIMQLQTEIVTSFLFLVTSTWVMLDGFGFITNNLNCGCEFSS